MLYIFLTLFAAAIVALDQWTKALAAAQLTDVVDVLIPGWLELRYTTNDGMALSMLSGARWLFVVVGVLFVALVIWAVAKKHITKKPELWCIAAITGGAIGNLLDRLFRGYVVDLFDFSLINFPVFNFADVCICVGVGLLVLSLLLDMCREQKAKQQKGSAPTDGTA